MNTEPETIEKIRVDTPIYWQGRENILVRYWVYLHRGLDFINQARYWILGIFALYAILKLTHPIFIPVMFILSTPVLIFIGRWHLHRVSKTQEFISVTRGTVTGYNTYNIQIDILKTLKEILQKK